VQVKTLNFDKSCKSEHERLVSQSWWRKKMMKAASSRQSHVEAVISTATKRLNVNSSMQCTALIRPILEHGSLQ